LNGITQTTRWPELPYSKKMLNLSQHLKRLTKLDQNPEGINILDESTHEYQTEGVARLIRDHSASASYKF
jgi:hypothetical protein